MGVCVCVLVSEDLRKLYLNKNVGSLYIMDMASLFLFLVCCVYILCVYVHALRCMLSL